MVEYLVENFEGELPQFYQQTIKDLEFDFGVRNDIITSKSNEQSIDVYNKMHKFRISFIPIIDSVNAGVVGFAFLNDLIYIMRTYEFEKLQMPIIQLIKEMNEIDVEISDQPSCTSATGVGEGPNDE